MKIAYVLGARPNFVKMAPVIAELRRRMPDGGHTIIHTGQHYDRMMSQVFMEELGVPEPDHILGVGSASHAVQTARVMERIEPVLIEERPDLVIVPGGVNSTFSPRRPGEYRLYGQHNDQQSRHRLACKPCLTHVFAHRAILRSLVTKASR